MAVCAVCNLSSNVCNDALAVMALRNSSLEIRRLSQPSARRWNAAIGRRRGTAQPEAAEVDRNRTKSDPCAQPQGIEQAAGAPMACPKANIVLSAKLVVQ